MANIPTPAQLAYFAAHPHDNLVPDIIACCSVCGIASVVFILLRLWARHLIHGRVVVNMSDWLLIIAFIFFAVFDICFALTTKYGSGRHIIYITDARMLQILNLVDENTYCYAMAFIKLSILKVYGDIFPSKKFHHCLWAMAIFMGAWAITFSASAIFQCTPIEYNWDLTIPGGFCINYGANVMAAGILNILTDFIILVMPIPLVLKLHTSTQKKLQIIFAFALGSSACIISFIRLGYGSKVGSTADGSWDNIPAGLASVAELMIGILAASIPTYRPIYRRFMNGSAMAQTQAGYNSDRQNYGNDSSLNKSTLRRVQIFSQHDGEPREKGDGIHITNQVEMSVYDSKEEEWDQKRRRQSDEERLT
ncbi:hypothetical protein HYFRA_00009052 [Hymenoscyphus fraxineus]|uniref:Rhodopsin domain-containing protein n=1 Tax=Hymenoscyphus fraxineus TaxID=746836 RepID=A0A9N9PST6_9HELO|nr:hypothetical protein HYFRA_00009052 [Hymenoscyphus fraxineus]